MANEQDIQMGETKMRSPERSESDTREQKRAEPRWQRIAEAAYYAAERRGFEGNRELDDWLEAERQVEREDHGQPNDIPQASETPTYGGESFEGEAARPARIEPPQVKHWAKELGVSAGTLREAIQRVGAQVDDVKQYLQAHMAES